MTKVQSLTAKDETIYRVVVIGNAGVDTNVYVPEQSVDLTREGHFTHNADTVGQAGGYASRLYARLGLPVAFVGALGNDAAGRMVHDMFVSEGINTDGVFKDPGGTARSVNLVFPDGTRTNFYDGKGHMDLHPDPAIYRNLVMNARLLHINLANWARETLPLARSGTASIACDLQDVRSADDPYRLDFVRAADYLFFSSTHIGDPRPLFEAYWQLNRQVIMVAGMGASGCALAADGQISFFSPVSHTAPVVDTNGAGDALAVGFLAARIFENQALGTCVERGQKLARMVISEHAPKPLSIGFRE